MTVQGEVEHADQSAVFERARQTRDARFDGRFFIAVKTTKIYCRPVCSVKMPRSENVTFYMTAAAAAEAGYRPCLRCRPEAAPGTPAWLGTQTTVNRALSLIAEGALDGASVEDLADRLGVTSRHLSRLFAQYLGASPKAVAQTRRLHFAKKLLNETNLPVTQVAMSSGYASVRRFNDHFKSVYQRAPSSVRTKREAKLASESEAFLMKLSYRPPYDFSSVLGFLKVRAIPGVEHVSADSYQRAISLDGEAGHLKVTQDPAKNNLLISLKLPNPSLLRVALERVAALFDLHADPVEICSLLSKDPQLAPMVAENLGQRVPGAWDSFEIAVRAIVGQQVSVKGATTVMGRIAETYGKVTEYGQLFPGPGALAKLDIDTMSMPKKRAQSIKDMAQAVLDGSLSLSRHGESEALIEQLVAIKGIGPWTAQYVTMRALANPDAFLVGDLVLRKVAIAFLDVENDTELLARSQAWKPWRAYAGMHLWRQAARL